MELTTQEMKSYICENTIGAAHVCIAVKDMDESIKFYTEILGFTLIENILIDGNGLAFLQTQNMTLELSCFASRTPILGGRCYDTLGGIGRIWHMCMFCKEEAMKDIIAYFEKLDVPIVQGYTWNPTVYEKGSACFFILGPDGEMIEFNTPPKDVGYAYFNIG